MWWIMSKNLTWATHQRGQNMKNDGQCLNEQFFFGFSMKTKNLARKLIFLINIKNLILGFCQIYLGMGKRFSSSVDGKAVCWGRACCDTISLENLREEDKKVEEYFKYDDLTKVAKLWFITRQFLALKSHNKLFPPLTLCGRNLMESRVKINQWQWAFCGNCHGARSCGDEVFGLRKHLTLSKIVTTRYLLANSWNFLLPHKRTFPKFKGKQNFLLYWPKLAVYELIIFSLYHRATLRP